MKEPAGPERKAGPSLLMGLDAHKASGTVLRAMMILSRKVTIHFKKNTISCMKVELQGDKTGRQGKCQEAVIVQVRDDGGLH